MNTRENRIPTNPQPDAARSHYARDASGCSLSTRLSHGRRGNIYPSLPEGKRISTANNAAAVILETRGVAVRSSLRVPPLSVVFGQQWL